MELNDVCCIVISVIIIIIMTNYLCRVHCPGAAAVRHGPCQVCGGRACRLVQQRLPHALR
jgi:hypothetical protein